MIRQFLIRIYLSSLLAFSFVPHPVNCCFLLLGGSLRFCLFLFLSSGFRWYILLFCLVYVGGIYILFVYVSMFSPKAFAGLGYSVSSFVISLSVFTVFFYFSSEGVPLFREHSHYVCSWRDGYGYCFFCLMLLLGFRLVRFIGSSKSSFFR